MGWSEIKRRPADIKFSNWIREKAGWKCQKCGKVCKLNGLILGQLDASHYYGRGKESTRFEPDNVHALCNPCHRRMGGYQKDEQGEYDLWMKEILGEKRYKTLKLQANTYQKKDDKLILIWLKNETNKTQ